MNELLLADELNDYFTFVKKVTKLGQEFEIYLDDYGQSFIVAWLENDVVQEVGCGTYNSDWEIMVEYFALKRIGKQIEQREILSKDILEELVTYYAIQTTNDGKTTIIDCGDKYFAIDWFRESNYSLEQPYEVEKKRNYYVRRIENED